MTSSSCTPGDDITVGESIVSVDGIARVAYRGSVPLYRPISSGVSGDDVQALRSFLAGRGADVDVESTRFDAELARAIRAYAVSIGYPSVTTTFDPAWLVWLPQDTFVPATCNMQLGATVGADGLLATAVPPLVALDIDTARPPWPDDEDLALSIAGQTVPLETATTGALQIAAGFDLSRLAPLLLPTGAMEGDGQPVTAEVRFSSPALAYLVPPSAILLDDGRACVFGGPIDDPETIEIQILESTPAGTVVRASGAAELPELIITGVARMTPEPGCD